MRGFANKPPLCTLLQVASVRAKTGTFFQQEQETNQFPLSSHQISFLSCLLLGQLHHTQQHSTRPQGSSYELKECVCALFPILFNMPSLSEQSLSSPSHNMADPLAPLGADTHRAFSVECHAQNSTPNTHNGLNIQQPQRVLL